MQASNLRHSQGSRCVGRAEGRTLARHPLGAQQQAHSRQRQQRALGGAQCQQVPSRRGVRASAAVDVVALPAPIAEFQPDTKPGFFTVKGRLLLNSDPALVWQVLTDYESSAAVFSNIQGCTVEAREDGRKQLLQKCGWRFLAFSGAFDCRLVVDEDLENRKLLFNLVESSFMKDFEGKWHVQPSSAPPSDGTSSAQAEDAAPPSPTAAAAQGGDSWCVVEHVLSVKPLMPVPPPFSIYTRSIFCKQVEAVLRDLQQEVLRQQAAAQQQRPDDAAMLN